MNPLFWVSVDLNHVDAYNHKLHDSFNEGKVYPVFGVQCRTGETKDGAFIEWRTVYYILDRNWHFRWILEFFCKIVAEDDGDIQMKYKLKEEK